MTKPDGPRVGYKASAEQFAPGELASYAVLAEELGVSRLHVSISHDAGVAVAMVVVEG